MSSLLTTASIWNNDDDPKPKKRIPTMQNGRLFKPEQQSQNGRLFKPEPSLQPKGQQIQSYNSAAAVSAHDTTTPSRQEARIPDGIVEVQAAAAQRTARIHEMLQSDNNGGGGALGDFEPLDHPILQKRTEQEVLEKETSSNSAADTLFFHPSPSASASSSAYHQAYDPASNVYHSDHPATRARSPPPVNDDRWMEKMNYMIYLLEQQQNEKTSHVTEEFVLYAFLGVFIIFVVDAFSRGGRYVR
jgi:hypothetical protein